MVFKEGDKVRFTSEALAWHRNAGYTTSHPGLMKLMEGESVRVVGVYGENTTYIGPLLAMKTSELELVED